MEHIKQSADLNQRRCFKKFRLAFIFDVVISAGLMVDSISQECQNKGVEYCGISYEIFRAFQSQ